jgi:hypothetical protein
MPKAGIVKYIDRQADDTGPCETNALTVFDSYSDTTDFNGMSNDQRSKLKQKGGLGQGYLFLLSWTLTGGTKGTRKPIYDLEALSGMANPWVPHVMREALASAVDGAPLPNIVYLDFIDPFLCSSIIALNDAKWQRVGSEKLRDV